MTFDAKSGPLVVTREAWAARDYMAVFDSAGEVQALRPELECEDRGARVRIAGRAVKFLQGEIFIESGGAASHPLKPPLAPPK